jgi:hypothetical protein
MRGINLFMFHVFHVFMFFLSETMTKTREAAWTPPRAACGANYPHQAEISTNTDKGERGSILFLCGE